MKNPEELEKMRLEVERIHHCQAVHLETVAVHEQAEGKTVWKGDVEVFELSGHEMATRCYAWAYAHRRNDSPGRYGVMLGVPPITNAVESVRHYLTLARRYGLITPEVVG